MPIWLRKFTHNEIREFKEKEAEAYQKSNNVASPGKGVSRPTFEPSSDSKITYNKK